MSENAFKSLSDKAQRLEKFTQEKLVDKHGVVYASLNTDTMQPWAAADISPRDHYIEVAGFETWEVLNYENSGMTTGAYLAAQSYRWLVTGEESALQLAQRSFRALQHIYAIGCTHEVGFFPKTYGGRLSHEISSDQYLYAIKGMMAYLPVAPAEDAAAIRRIVPELVDFWVRRGYRYDYFALKDMLWPLGRFPSLLYAAHAVSGDAKYLQEAERLNSEHQVYLNPTDSQILVRAAMKVPFAPIEQELGGYLASWITECSAMDIMELDECLLHSNSYREEWLRSMQVSWQEAKLCLAENGLSYAWTLYDPESGTATAPPVRWSGDTDALGYNFSQYMAPFVNARSTMLARVAVIVAHWLPAEGARVELLNILQNVELEHMRHVIDPDNDQLLPEHRIEGLYFDGDAITNWLWAYWQGRYQGVIAEPQTRLGSGVW